MMMIVTVAALGPIGAAKGLAYMQESHRYSCAPLTGVAGMLQKMNLLAQGNCVVGKNGKCDSPGKACKVSNPSGIQVNGACTNLTGKNGGCDCVPK
jgi:hypothetical protein